MTIWLRSTGSTMRDAAALAVRGEPHGTAIVAEEQTAGVGRHGHTWDSQFGGGLYLSIILRPELPPDALPVLTMALGIAAKRAVDHVASVKCDIRWPNDLLLNGKKIAGIMVQTADSALIAGIGINVNQAAFPEDLREIATSLQLETGQEQSKEALLDCVLKEALEYTSKLEREGKAAILREFQDCSSYTRGKDVRVSLGERTIEGGTVGLDENGFLRVWSAGRIELILTGGVRERSAGPIAIVSYDTAWPGVFDAEATRVRRILGDRVLRLEHIGSTSVPGLAAKPIIDMMLVVADSAAESSYVPALEAAGYGLKIREPEWFEHRMFKGPAADINLHVYSQGCEEIERVLIFRDWLRGDAAERELYARTKIELASREWKRVQDYADAKTAVVQQIMARARDARLKPGTVGTSARATGGV